MTLFLTSFASKIKIAKLGLKVRIEKNLKVLEI